jgi:hypothetical protein
MGSIAHYGNDETKIAHYWEVQASCSETSSLLWERHSAAVFKTVSRAFC